MKIEKVYGDFERLHAFIIETFQNELREYEKIQQKSGEGKKRGLLFNSKR